MNAACHGDKRLTRVRSPGTLGPPSCIDGTSWARALRRETKIGGESRDEAQQMARVFLLGSLQSRVPLLSHLSFPKIRSGRIRAGRIRSSSNAMFAIIYRLEHL